MLLNEFKITEMAAASPWTTFVRGLITNNPNITDAAINALVAQNGITPPNFLQVRLDGIRKSIATQVAKRGGVAPPPKAAKVAKTPSNTTTSAPTAPKTLPVAQPAPVSTTPTTGHDAEYIQKIANWLNANDVSNYTINPDTYVVDVNGDVHLDKFFHTKLPVKFGIIDGDFYVAASGITSLQGCPDHIKGRFSCQNNKNLKSAHGGPQIVEGSVDFENCALMTIDGLPKEIHGDLDLQNTKITSLAGFHKQVKILDGILALGKSAGKITDSIMGLILVRKLRSVSMDWDSKQTKAGQAFDILNKHLEGDRSGPDCQIEMQDAGLAQFAKM